MRFTNAALPGGAIPQTMGVFTPTITPPAPGTLTMTAPMNIAALLVTATTATRPFCAAASTPSINGLNQWQWCAPFGPSASNPGGTWQAVVPVAAAAGDTVTLDVYMSAAALVSVNVAGLTSCPVQVRADGRAYPLGSLASGLYNATASGPLVPAPPAPLRILLGSAWMAGSEAQMTSSINGAGATLAMNYSSTGPSNAALPEGGVLLDEATALGILQIGTVQIVASALFDLVV